MKLTAMQYYHTVLREHKSTVLQFGAVRAHEKGIKPGHEGSGKASTNGDT